MTNESWVVLKDGKTDNNALEQPREQVIVQWLCYKHNEQHTVITTQSIELTMQSLCSMRRILGFMRRFKERGAGGEEIERRRRKREKAK